jgi:hypothetical protein
VETSEPAWPVVAFDDGDFPAVFNGVADLVNWEEDEFWNEVSHDERTWGRVVFAFDQDFRPCRIVYRDDCAPVVVPVAREADPELFKRKAIRAMTVFYRRTRMWRRASRVQRTEFASWAPDRTMRELLAHVRNWDQS